VCYSGDYMRMLVVLAVLLLSIFSAGCAVRLQPAQQGEWSDFQDKADQVSNDVKHPPEGAEK